MDPHWKPTDHGAFGSIVRRSGGLTDKQISERRLKQKKQQDKEDAEALRKLTENQLRAQQAQRAKQSQRTEQVRREREARQEAQKRTEQQRQQAEQQRQQAEKQQAEKQRAERIRNSIVETVNDIKKLLRNDGLDSVQEEDLNNLLKKEDSDEKLTNLINLKETLETKRKNEEMRQTQKLQSLSEDINKQLKVLSTFGDSVKGSVTNYQTRLETHANNKDLDRMESLRDAVKGEVDRQQRKAPLVREIKEGLSNVNKISYKWYKGISDKVAVLRAIDSNEAKELAKNVIDKAEELTEGPLKKWNNLIKDPNVISDAQTSKTIEELDKKLIRFELVELVNILNAIDEDIEEYGDDDDGLNDFENSVQQWLDSQKPKNPSTVQGGDDALPPPPTNLGTELEKPPLSALYLQKMHLQEPSMEKLDVDMSLDQDEVDVHVEPSSRQADTLYCSQPYESSGAKVRGNPHGGAPYKGEAAQKAKEMASQQARRDRKTEYLKNLAKAKAERRRNKVHGMESSEGMFGPLEKMVKKYGKKAEEMAKKYGKKGKEIADAIAKTMEQENPQEVAGCGMDTSSDESDSEMKLCDECGEMDDHFHVCAEVCEKPPCLTHGIAERKMSELSI